MSSETDQYTTNTLKTVNWHVFTQECKNKQLEYPGVFNSVLQSVNQFTPTQKRLLEYRSMGIDTFITDDVLKVIIEFLDFNDKYNLKHVNKTFEKLVQSAKQNLLKNTTKTWKCLGLKFDDAMKQKKILIFYLKGAKYTWHNIAFKSQHLVDSFKTFSHSAQDELLKTKFNVKGIDAIVKEFLNQYKDKYKITYQFGAVIDYHHNKETVVSTNLIEFVSHGIQWSSRGVYTTYKREQIYFMNQPRHYFGVVCNHAAAYAYAEYFYLAYVITNPFYQESH